MGTRRPARLYQKKTGVFFIRILLATSKLARSEKGQTKGELRRSLGTKCVTTARSISSYMNALLERVPVEERPAIVAHHLPHAISTWTLPGGIQCNGDDDQRRLSEFLRAHPLIEQALAQRIANAPLPTPPAPQVQWISSTLPATEPSESIRLDRQTATEALATSTSDEARRTAGHAKRHGRMLDPSDWPKHPTRFSVGRAKYKARYEKLETQKERTQTDKDRIFDHFEEYLQKHHPELGTDPWIHDIDSTHVGAFLEEQANRPGKRLLVDGTRSKAAPTTMLKKLSDMGHFFTYQRKIAKATEEDVSGDLAELAETWTTQAVDADVHYRPFTTDHVKRIFAPAKLLAYNREPDYFFAPLLGLHLAVRLGDFVRAKLSDIGYIKEIDVWYIDVTPEDAKNKNSVRRLPITKGLIDAGFLDYVEHVRKLGAIYLFPHRDWSTATAKSKPSKRQSEQFAKYMDKIGLPDPMLVYHSFRHTAITAMQDAGVPLSHAMQIAGHEAIEHALKTKKITPEQARSVHVTVYTHAELESMSSEYPILKFKDALERSIKAPIDYEHLAKASKVVIAHVKKVGGEIRAGWPAQDAKYTEEMVQRIFN